MNQTTAAALRRFIALLMIIALGLILSIIGYRLLVQPRIVVLAPAGSTITITSLEQTGYIQNIKAASLSTSIPVDAGSYIVDIDTGTGRQVQYANAGFFRGTKVQADVKQPLSVHIASQQVAYDAVPNGHMLTYLDTTKRSIMQLDDKGDLRQLDGVAQNIPGYTGAQAIGPIGDNQAVVLSNSKLYILRNGRLTALDTTGFPTSIASIALGTSQSQTSFVIGINQTLYWYTSSEAKPQKIIELQKRFDRLAVGGHMIIAYSTRMPDAQEDIKASYATTYAIDPLLIDGNSKGQQILADGPIVTASISPDGAYATLESRSASHTIIYRLSQRSKAYTVENPDITTPQWMDATHFVYGKDSAVWKFDVSTQSADAIGIFPSGYQPTSIVYDAVNKQYFVTTYPGSSAATVFRLSSTPVDSSASTAASLAAGDQANSLFHLAYVDITKPTLRITTSVVLNNPTSASFRKATLDSRQAALAYLRSNDIDPGKLTIVYDPANP